MFMRVLGFMFIQVGIPCKWINDSKHLLMEHFDVIHNSPSQIYHSALPFCPPSSWLCKHYSAELSLRVRVVKGLPVEWGACFCTVSIGDLTLSLSYWNNTVAVGFGSGNIIILDAITGSQVAILPGHTGWVRSLAFSSDGRSLVSGSHDTTVKFWDMQTGGVIKTFHGHTSWVCSVSISADCTRIASGSEAGTIHLWDIQTGECYQTIKQEGSVDCVIFSSIDSQYIISISNRRFWQWDVNGNQILPIDSGTHIDFSPDHTQFALCRGNRVTVHITDYRATVADFYVPKDNTKHCCFSTDGRFVAAAAGNTAYVWDITSPDPDLVETFIVPAGKISSLVFSSPSSLISASYDGLIKFWQIDVMSIAPVATDLGPSPPVSPSIEPSPPASPSFDCGINFSVSPPAPPLILSVSLQPRAGIAISIDVDGVVKTWDLSTGICKASFKTPAGEADTWGRTDAQLVDGRLICIWYKNRGIYILDIEENKPLQVLESFPLRGLRISGDGSTIIALGEEYMRIWLMWTWEPVVEVGLDLMKPIYLDPLCIDSSRVCVKSKISSDQEGWDVGTSGSSPGPFDPSTGRPHLDFIGGAKWQTGGPSWIKDTVTGKKVFQLSGRYAEPNDVQWDGQYLVAGYGSGEVLILDFHSLLP